MSAQLPKSREDQIVDAALNESAPPEPQAGSKGWSTERSDAASGTTDGVPSMTAGVDQPPAPLEPLSDEAVERMHELLNDCQHVVEGEIVCRACVRAAIAAHLPKEG